MKKKLKSDSPLRAATGSASSGVDFNINNYVHVRLTPHGRKCLRENYDELANHFGGELSWDFRLPEEDADGWSKWQMYELMDALGQYVGMGRELPFEMNIRIELPRQNAIAPPVPAPPPGSICGRCGKQTNDPVAALLHKLHCTGPNLLTKPN